MRGVIHDGATRVPIQQPVLLFGTVAARPFPRGVGEAWAGADAASCNLAAPPWKARKGNL